MSKTPVFMTEAPGSSGLTNLRKYKAGQRLTQGQAILANCCECMGYYIDGRRDCQQLDCVFYTYFPYKNA